MSTLATPEPAPPPTRYGLPVGPRVILELNRRPGMTLDLLDDTIEDQGYGYTVIAIGQDGHHLGAPSPIGCKVGDTVQLGPEEKPARVEGTKLLPPHQGIAFAHEISLVVPAD